MVSRNQSLAHALARITLGTNIVLHGLMRIGHIGGFASGLRPEFASTILPGFLVEIAGYVIVLGETVVGFLVLVGLGLRGALVAGLLLMLLLESGTCLRQDWNVAGLQLIYVGLYAALLATLHCDRYSLDGARRRPAEEPARS
ncbi:MAG TPA: DoxX family protein [Opitutaceae bacterium]